jgi:hypothetical protein
MLGLNKYRNVTEYYKIIFVSIYDKNTVSCTWERGESANNGGDRVDKYLAIPTFHQELTS